MSSLTLSPPSTRTLPDEFADALLNIFEFSEEEIEVAVLKQTSQLQSEVEKYAKYLNDPVGFAKEILHVDLVPLQEKALRCLLEAPYRVLCPSGNGQGKSNGAACAAIWWHCTRSPSVITTTAPNVKQVRDILWKEIRKLSRSAGLNLQFLPKDCRIERAPDDFAVGKTAKDESGFQGQHGPNQLFIIDEATGTEPWLLEAIEGQFSPPGHALMVLFNPTKNGTWVHNELTGAERGKHSGKYWHVTRMSALDHPNIDAELRGDEPVVPHAMRLAKFDRLFRTWSQLVGCPIGSDAQLATDVVWPPVWATEYCERTRQRPRVWRPGPLAEAKLLGRFARQGVNSVWSDGDWIAASREGLPLLPIEVQIPQIGFDCARFGDDFSSTAVRCGAKLIYFTEVNGQDTVASSESLMKLAADYAKWHNDMRNALPPAKREKHPEICEYDVPIKIDDDGVGGSVTDQLKAAGYHVIPISAASRAISSTSAKHRGHKKTQDEYPNRRSELWFVTAERARDDELDLSGILGDASDPTQPQLDEEGEIVRLIDEDTIDELKRQFMAATYKLDNRARRVVCPKDEQKSELGRSPDGADAVNLCFAEVPDYTDAMPEVLYSKADPLGRRRMQR